jgi:DNA-binding transcriptional ArsR family regulator
MAGLLRALAHPLRLRIVALLCSERTYVGAIAKRLGVPQAIASQQLRILRMSRLVAVSRSNGLAVYRIAEPRLRGLLRCMKDCPLV